MYVRYTAASDVLPISFALCSIAIAACILCACFLPEPSILLTLAFASLTVANFSPCIVPFGFSSVYKSECESEPAGCPFFLGILGASLNCSKLILGPEVLKSFFLITVFATSSNSPPFRFNTNGILISVFISLITASASGPSCAIFLPYFLKDCLNSLVSSAGVICFTFLLSFTLSKKCRVNSTSIPSDANILSAYFST